MKKVMKIATIFVAIAFIFAGTSAFAQAKAKYHVGVVTGTTSQSEDEFRAAEWLMKTYGKAAEGGMIQHVVYPDDFPSQQETVISGIEALANDPMMKVVVVVQAIPGVTEAFRRIRAKRPDITLLGGMPQEDLPVVSATSDMIVDFDQVSRGYTIIWAAKQLGAKTFVHISFARHMAIEQLSRRRAIFEQACKDLGLKFAFETAPDPTSDVGMAGAQQFISEKVPQWLLKYGPNGEKVCMFATNDGQTEPLLRELIKSKTGVFVESDIPSPLMGYPAALGVDLKAESGNFDAIVNKIEKAIVAKGAAGRFGTWKFSSNYCITAGLAIFGMNIVDKKAKKDSMNDLFTALAVTTPGVQWKGSYYTDASTGVRSKNVVTVFMDTYIMGAPGYVLATTKQKIDPKYYTIK